MNEEQKFYSFVVGIICTSIVIVLVSVIASYHVQRCKMIENGWTRGTLQGAESPAWYKETGE